MKKNALVAFGLLISLVSAGAAFGKEVSKPADNFSLSGPAGITVEQARRIALQKVAGAVEDEYTIEDENENVTTYIFLIKNNQGKIFEIQIDANSGNILNVNEQNGEINPARSGISAGFDANSKEDPPEAVIDSNDFNINYSDQEQQFSAEINSTVSYTGRNDNKNYAASDTGLVPQFTLEQARFVALLRINGQIQSERPITDDDGRPAYLFIIKFNSDKLTEVRVDAVSGKARRIRSKRP